MSEITDHHLLKRLTPAESRVASCLVEGLSNKEIACLLGKAEATIKHQVSAILTATGAESRAQFTALYYQRLLGEATRRGTRAPAGSKVFTPFLAAPNRATKKPEPCCVCAAAGSHTPGSGI